MKLKLLTISIIILLAVSASASIHLAPRLDSTPSDITYVEGTTGNELEWTATAHEADDDPTVYFVRVDGNVMEDHNGVSWQDGVPIVVNVDGYSVGTYEVEIEIRDSGYPEFLAAFDSVTMTVTSDTGGGDSTSSSTTSSTTSSPTSTTQTTTPSTSNTPGTSSSSDTDQASILLLFSLTSLILLPILLKSHKE